MTSYINLCKRSVSYSLKHVAISLRQLLLELFAGGLDQRRGQRFREFDFRFAVGAGNNRLCHASLLKSINRVDFLIHVGPSFSVSHRAWALSFRSSGNRAGMSSWMMLQR